MSVVAAMLECFFLVFYFDQNYQLNQWVQFEILYLGSQVLLEYRDFDPVADQTSQLRRRL